MDNSHKQNKRIKQIASLPKDTVYSQIDSPVGLLTLFVSSKGVHHILWEDEIHSLSTQQILSQFKSARKHDLLSQTKKQLKEYFNGQRKQFQVPVCLHGTPFQIRAWQTLRKIPYAKTISYGEQALKLGDKNKARAVGLANGANPISIIIPCHRVIGSNGKLTGFGGGLNNKACLLELEQMYQ